MPKIPYITKNFKASSIAIIDIANKIIQEYARQGFDLTLRQLYYQFVARSFLANTQKEYKRLGNIINDGRLAGLIDWNTIVDRLRVLNMLATWDNPGQIIRAAYHSFKTDLWKNQRYRLEVWIEKDALTGVIAGICQKHRVPYFACRGYTSQSAMWRAAMRLSGYLEAEQTPVILHFGDHDPSGIDMTRDTIDRLDMFLGAVEVKRLALNMDQVDEYGPPPNPAKITDTRAKAYIAKYGNESWELDALEPKVIEALIEKAVLEFRDSNEWDKSLEVENEYKGKLEYVADHWEDGLWPRK